MNKLKSVPFFTVYHMKDDVEIVFQVFFYIILGT